MARSRFSAGAILAVAVAFTAAGVSGSKAVFDTDSWRSKYFDVGVKIQDGWRSAYVNSPGDTYDTSEKVVAAFLNKTGPYAYILQVEKDASLDELSVEEYHDAVRRQYTSHEAHTLIDEEHVELHGQPFYRFRFRVEGTTGPGATYLYIHRDGKLLVNLLWSFPIVDGEDISVPEAISAFHANVTLPLRPKRGSD